MQQPDRDHRVYAMTLLCAALSVTLSMPNAAAADWDGDEIDVQIEFESDRDDDWNDDADWRFHFEMKSPHLGRGRIGVEIQPMTPELREFMHAPGDRGVLVTRVEKGRPAAKAGLRVGDIILQSGDDDIKRPFDLVRSISRAASDEPIKIEIVRTGKKRTLEVTPEGPSLTWLDPHHWTHWLENGLRQGSQEIRHRLREIERRLEEMEQHQKSQTQPNDGQST